MLLTRYSQAPNAGRCVGVLLFVTIVCLLYYPGLHGGFYYDDSHVLVYNAEVKLQHLSWEGLLAAARSFQFEGRPLSMLSFAFNYYFFGESAFAIKAVNLAIHILIGFILLRITQILLRVFAIKTEDKFMQALLCYAPAALWLLQPINLGAVLYAAQRMALLAAMFTALGIYLYLQARHRWRHRAARIAGGAGVIACVYLGFLAKENGALLIGFIALLELAWFFHQRDSRARMASRRILLIAIATIFACILAVIIFPSQLESLLLKITINYKDRHFTLDERVLSQFRALSFYLSQLIAPAPGALSMFHDDFAVSKNILTPATTLPALLFICALLAAWLLAFESWPLLAIALGWFFVGHSMESTIVPLEMMHEHRNYFASYGVGLALIYLITRANARRAIQLVLIGALFFWHAGALWQRSLIWSDDFRKAEFEVRRHPESPSALSTFAQFHLRAAADGDARGVQTAAELLHLARIKETYTIGADVASIIMLNRIAGPNLLREWINAAAEKIKQYPSETANTRALRALLACLKDGVCTEDVASVEPLFLAAASTGTSNLLRAAAVYYDFIRKDSARAEGFLLRAEETFSTFIGPLVDTTMFYINRKDFDKACKRWHIIQTADLGGARYYRRELRDIARALAGKCD